MRSFLHKSCNTGNHYPQILPTYRILPTKNTFIDLMHQNGSYRISSVYDKLLNVRNDPDKQSFQPNWSKDFPAPDLDARLLQGNNTVRHLICSEVWRETQMKILHRAYIPYLNTGVTQKRGNQYRSAQNVELLETMSMGLS